MACWTLHSCYHLPRFKKKTAGQPSGNHGSPVFCRGFPGVYDQMMGKMGLWDDQHGRHHHDDAAAETKGLRAALQVETCWNLEEIWGKYGENIFNMLQKWGRKPSKRLLMRLLALLKVGAPKNLPVHMSLTEKACPKGTLKKAPSENHHRQMHQVTSRRQPHKLSVSSSLPLPQRTSKTELVGGLVAIFYFPIYWVSNHPNWRSYFSEGWPNHQPGDQNLQNSSVIAEFPSYPLHYTCHKAESQRGELLAFIDIHSHSKKLGPKKMGQNWVGWWQAPKCSHHSTRIELHLWWLEYRMHSPMDGWFCLRNSVSKGGHV